MCYFMAHLWSALRNISKTQEKLGKPVSPILCSMSRRAGSHQRIPDYLFFHLQIKGMSPPGRHAFTWSLQASPAGHPRGKPTEEPEQIPPGECRHLMLSFPTEAEAAMRLCKAPASSGLTKQHKKSSFLCDGKHGQSSRLLMRELMWQTQGPMVGEGRISQQQGWGESPIILLI